MSEVVEMNEAMVMSEVVEMSEITIRSSIRLLWVVSEAVG